MFTHFTGAASIAFKNVVQLDPVLPVVGVLARPRSGFNLVVSWGLQPFPEFGMGLIKLKVGAHGAGTTSIKRRQEGQSMPSLPSPNLKSAK